MQRGVALALALLIAALSAPAGAQTDPVLGNWRGTLTSAAGTESPIIITIIKKADGYAGSTNGVSESSEIPLARITVSGTNVSFESAAESKLGNVVLSGEVVVEGTTMKGGGTLAIGQQRFPVTLSLQRRARQDVVQPQVEQRIDYFVGRWKFEYVGAEYPPLSAGARDGTVTFTRVGASNFVTGEVEGELLGKRYREILSIGFDPDTNTLVYLERRPDAIELVSLGNWRSPLAITFHTSPVQANGRTYQLRRVISIYSDSAFDVTEECSVDSGPFRRLGRARFTKVP
jgi:hypothetical protein